MVNVFRAGWRLEHIGVDIDLKKIYGYKTQSSYIYLLIFYQQQCHYNNIADHTQIISMSCV